MSTSNSELEQVVSQTLLLTRLLYGYGTAGLTALVAYEYFITFDQEVATVWKRKLTATSVLLLLTRWTMITTQILTYVPITSQKQPINADSSGCKAIEVATTVFTTLEVLNVALFSSLRIFAIWERNYILAFVVFVLSFVPAGVDMYSWTHSSFIFVNDSVIQCTQIINYSNQIDTELLFTISIIEIAIGQTTSDIPIAPFIDVMPSVLVNRFILNLRQATSAPAGSTSVTRGQGLSQVSDPAFVVPQSYLGDIGEDLEPNGGENELSANGRDIEADDEIVDAYREE
ncbi:hypothetical protein PHLGIDRAFT_122368 [Phlebiopsis gigantea 11061_1 CR5-6]|uniref:DUF6533 domain-containing protein n=1 Tax=Phlebiopsis gigantea (strain 11061_1 CR5-6) TaxID=745531 RepID=A0A0C3S3R1_PHLG1|nr:hypothetical protein PHLGIDRAFT_122368 [Phlebiopsis gigantea 11061_1 CR5-6]